MNSSGRCDLFRRGASGGSCPGSRGSRSAHPPRLRSSLCSLLAGPRGTRASREPLLAVPPAAPAPLSRCALDLHVSKGTRDFRETEVGHGSWFAIAARLADRQRPAFGRVALGGAELAFTDYRRGTHDREIGARRQLFRRKAAMVAVALA